MHHQIGFSPISRLKQCWEVLGHSTSGVPIGKRSQAGHPLHGWDFKDCSLGSPLWSRKQTDIIVNLSKTAALVVMFIFLQCCLLCSANLGMLLVLVGQMAQQIQRSSLYLSMVALSQPSQQAWLTLTAAVRAMSRQVRSKVRGLLCFVSEA